MAFEPTRETPVSGGLNKGLNSGNLVANSKTTGGRDHGGGGGMGRNME